MSKIGSRVQEVGSRDFIVEPEEEALRSQVENSSSHHLHHHHRRSRREVEEEETALRRSRLRGVVSRSRSRRALQDRNSHRQQGPRPETDSDDELYDSLFGEEELLTLQIPDDVSGGSYPHHTHLQSQSGGGGDSHQNPNQQQLFELDSSGGLNLNGSTMNPSLSLPDRNRVHHHHHHAHHSHHQSHHESTASLLDSMERRTQRTYRYGIGLVCVGATLNWLGFAQGHGYVDPLRYLGVACVISGSFCVCLAMCRWLGRPISVSSHHHVGGLSPMDYQDDRNVGRHHQNGDVHVINVSVPMYVPHMHEEYRPTKPPDYEMAVAGEPPPYDEAIKLRPNDLFAATAAPTDKSAIQNSNSNSTSSTTGTSGSDTYFSCAHPSMIPSHLHHQNQNQIQDQNTQTSSSLSVVQTHSQSSNQNHGQGSASASAGAGARQTIVATAGASTEGDISGQGQSQGGQASGITVFVGSTPTNASTMSTSLAESNQSPYRAAPSFRPDGVVVVVDASESANPILNSNLNSVKVGGGGNNLNINSAMGAPPPYTREYTPSPRRAPPTPTPSSVSNQSSYPATGGHSNSNSNNNYAIASVHSYHNSTTSNNNNNNQISSTSHDNQNIYSATTSSLSASDSNSSSNRQNGNVVTVAESESHRES